MTITAEEKVLEYQNNFNQTVSQLNATIIALNEVLWQMVNVRNTIKDVYPTGN